MTYDVFGGTLNLAQLQFQPRALQQKRNSMHPYNSDHSLNILKFSTLKCSRDANATSERLVKATRRQRCNSEVPLIFSRHKPGRLTLAVHRGAAASKCEMPSSLFPPAIQTNLFASRLSAAASRQPETVQTWPRRN